MKKQMKNENKYFNLFDKCFCIMIIEFLYSFIFIVLPSFSYFITLLVLFVSFSLTVFVLDKLLMFLIILFF